MTWEGNLDSICIFLFSGWYRLGGVAVGQVEVIPVELGTMLNVDSLDDQIKTTKSSITIQIIHK